MSNTYLSFDCATKSLAVTHLTITSDLTPTLHACLTAYATKQVSLIDTVRAVDAILCRWIVIHSMEVIDLLPGKKVRETGELERTRALKTYLRALDARIQASGFPINHVIVEHQPQRVGKAANSNSTYVSMQLLLWYCDHQLTLIDPKRKNTITCAKVGSYETIRAASKDNYEARKRHAKETFLHIVKTFGWEKHIAGIRKPNYDDIADSFLQVWALACTVQK